MLPFKGDCVMPACRQRDQVSTSFALRFSRTLENFGRLAACACQILRAGLRSRWFVECIVDGNWDRTGDGMGVRINGHGRAFPELDGQIGSKSYPSEARTSQLVCYPTKNCTKIGGKLNC